jgi:hypothetical protein
MTKTELAELDWGPSSSGALSVDRNQVVLDATGKEANILDSQTETPTIASTWNSVAGRPITNELLEWPADLFALTNVTLARSEAYIASLCPHPAAQSGRRVAFPTGPMRSQRQAVNGEHGSTIGNVHSLIFWLKNGMNSASEFTRPWSRSHRDVNGECAKLC